MYAIIRTGGKQYRVKKGQTVDIEKLQGEPGSKIEFQEVLFVFDGTNALIGKPKVPDSSVKAEIVGHLRGPKIDSIKYKRRKNQRTHWGHRQNYWRVRITDISCQT